MSGLPDIDVGVQRALRDTRVILDHWTRRTYGDTVRISVEPVREKRAGRAIWTGLRFVARRRRRTGGWESEAVDLPLAEPTPSPERFIEFVRRANPRDELAARIAVASPGAVPAGGGHGPW